MEKIRKNILNQMAFRVTFSFIVTYSVRKYIFLIVLLLCSWHSKRSLLLPCTTVHCKKRYLLDSFTFLFLAFKTFSFIATYIVRKYIFLAVFYSWKSTKKHQPRNVVSQRQMLAKRESNTFCLCFTKGFLHVKVVLRFLDLLTD